MEPEARQFPSEFNSFYGVLPKKERYQGKADFNEVVRTNPATGTFGANKPINSEPIDTKAVVNSIKTERARNAEASKKAKEFIAENATEIARLQAPSKRARRRKNTGK